MAVDKEIPLRTESDVVAARQSGREMAHAVGFSLAQQTRLATAISELTRNVIQYAGEGTCVIIDESDEGNRRIRVVIEDHGPGILDIEQAMEYGFSTGGGLGAGLPGSKNLMDQLSVDSRPGHTRITMGMTRPR